MPRGITSKEKFKTFGDVFDSFTLRNLFVLSSRGYFEEDTLSPISTGKESNVFSASGKERKVAVKIYRLETADFNRMYDYIKFDPRFPNLKKNKREVVFQWAQREYRNLFSAREAHVSCPLPISFFRNILIMELIGKEEPAKKIKDAIPENPKLFFEEVIENMKRFYKAGFVHSDLSKFNILNNNEKPVFIDFSQSTVLKNPRAGEFLRRDVKNVSDFFRRLGVKIEEERILREIKRIKEG